MRPVRSFATVAILALAAGAAYAQPILSAKSGVIAGVEGKVTLDNTDVPDSVTHFPEMKEGSVLRTEAGRVELMLPPGFMLRMGENGALKLLANRLIDTRVEIEAGSSVVEVDQTKPDFNVAIALKDGTVTLSKVGVYRFDTQPAQLKVFRGSASVEIGGQTVLVGTGKVLSLAGTAASAEKFDVEQTDALDNWSSRRAEAMAMANLSGAKYSNDSYAYTSAGAGSGNTWMYNPYYGMYTYMPGAGTMCNSFYGSCFYSPLTAYRAFYSGGYGYGFPYGASGGGSRGSALGIGTGAASTASRGVGGAFSSGGLGARSGGGTVGGGGISAPSSGGAGMSGGGGHMGGGGTGGHGR
ncbi:MAG TPA: hypothetical protein VHW09_03145 [Bryobacteraceae bacterium]|jgi:hypothetical protein|nr:hypothetical protein [Bryobacteraceae bacterium]